MPTVYRSCLLPFAWFRWCWYTPVSIVWKTAKACYYWDERQWLCEKFRMRNFERNDSNTDTVLFNSRSHCRLFDRFVYWSFACETLIILLLGIISFAWIHYRFRPQHLIRTMIWQAPWSWSYITARGLRFSSCPNNVEKQCRCEKFRMRNFERIGSDVSPVFYAFYQRDHR